MDAQEKPLVWIHGEVTAPPFSTEADAIVILEVFVKKSNKTPAGVLENCKQRLGRYKAIR